jgi:hypothetical protein
MSPSLPRPPGLPAPPPPPDLPLAALVAAADNALAHGGSRVGRPAGALLRVTAPTADATLELAFYPLDAAHPVDVLLGFVAPDHWRALGVSSTGLAHPVGDDGRVVRRADAPHVMITVLIDRSGRGAGVLREGDRTTPMPGAPEGVVADACRRALGLCTAPPPGGTAGLWTRCWLDRIVDAASRAADPDHRTTGADPGAADPASRAAADPASRAADAGTRAMADPAGRAADGGTREGGRGGRPCLDTWAAVARLHPAVPTTPPGWAHDPAPAPEALVEATRALADAWPWARLRADPGVVDLPGSVPAPHVIEWMDDGMWARWLLGAFPGVDDLVDAVGALLQPEIAAAVSEVVDASVDVGDHP